MVDRARLDALLASKGARRRGKPVLPFDSDMIGFIFTCVQKIQAEFPQYASGIIIDDIIRMNVMTVAQLRDALSVKWTPHGTWGIGFVDIRDARRGFAFGVDPGPNGVGVPVDFIGKLPDGDDWRQWETQLLDIAVYFKDQFVRPADPTLDGAHRAIRFH